MQTQTKVQMLKNTRDYSFLLSDDAEIPAPKKEPHSRNVSLSRPGVLLLKYLSVFFFSNLNMIFSLRKLIQVFW